ncbi:rhamnogalacturonan lyase [Bacillus changyiensis]|uniref:rhamnogalacturonan lyase n=1 Tax=Bacillus changyiensis TaxID=3004103 RepID=UPI0022DFA8AD|nr:rhamnogalacturonan lyase [Bacillus changyiensis]MDA1475848.1 rhamnogalacturonan lyase [Bacillus changyiensis]
MRGTKWVKLFVVVTFLTISFVSSFQIQTKASGDETGQARQMELLKRGLVAVKTEKGVFLSWRLLGTEQPSVSFNVYRNGRKLNKTPITSSTNYLDVNGDKNATYDVRAIINGHEQRPSDKAHVWGEQYQSIPLDKPAGGKTPDGVRYTYSANDASVGDLDGDGEYEIVLKWDPSNSKDNSQNGYTGEVFVDAYKLDGTRLWRIGLGKNIRAGAHYTQFLVYDFDGDGKAEVAMKTADGSRDGSGKVIGNAHTDYRNGRGRILSGNEYLTVFKGDTGKELATVNYDPARGKVANWGDRYGNRVDRFLACVAYLDGKTPSIVMARGYYAKTELVAYNWRGGKLTKRWTFDSSTPGNQKYAGQGNHNLSVHDVDNDGKDEILYGSMAIDGNGKGLYSTGLGHGDALHVGDLDPTKPGLEVFQVHEEKKSPYGLSFRDAATGKVIWGVWAGKDIGRGMAADIDPRYPGAEVWSFDGLYTAQGKKIGNRRPASINYGIWWDGDLQRELLDGNRIEKWDYQHERTNRLLTADGCSANNGSKETPTLQADILGDWREEAIWRTNDSSALRIYTTTNVTNHRLYTLMHDSAYRLGIAWQNIGYNQPPHTSFYLGEGMSSQKKPNIYTPKN